MKKRKKTPATSESIDQAFDVLDAALRSIGLLLPKDEDDVLISESGIDMASIQLPEGLRDPRITLERGRKILKEGFSVLPVAKTQSEASIALAQAARNGKEISQDVLEKMHRDRTAAELNSRKP